MPEVPKVTPPSSAPIPPRKDDGDVQKFDDIMNDRVAETDPEGKNKRKNPEQARKEREAEAARAEKSNKNEEVDEMMLTFQKLPGAHPASSNTVPETGSVLTPGQIKKSAKKAAAQKADSLQQTQQAQAAANKAADTAATAPPKAPEPAVPEVVSTETFEPTSSVKSMKQEPLKQETSTVSPQTQARGALLPIPVQSPAPYMQLSAQVLELFERMVGTMVVMNASGIKETTIHLNQQSMANSPFYGAQIVVQEHAHAPREFNIQLIGSPQAVEKFQANISLLYNTFQTSNYDFRVHRIDAGLKQESIRRKERSDERNPREEK